MRGFCGIGLYHPQKDVNIGGALRAAGCYEADFIAIQGRKLQNYASNTVKAERHIPLFHVKHFEDIIPYNCISIAVEIYPKARCIFDYVWPERSFIIFGPESSSLGKEVFSFCRDIVYIPTKYCLNLAVCVATVLYDRKMKQNINSNKNEN